MENKSLIWIWAVGGVLCLVQGFRDGNLFWFLSAALCFWNAFRWYKRYYQ